MPTLASEDWVEAYRVLAALGAPKPVVNWSGSPRAGMARESAALAWPELKFALLRDPEPVQRFQQAGWTVQVLQETQVRAWAEASRLVRDLRLTAVVQASTEEAKHTISSDENRLLRAFLEAGIPEPDRNHTISLDGVTTTPDFTWPGSRLAVFLDGYFHHGGRDLHEAIKWAAEDREARKRLNEGRADALASDAAKRRMLTAHGWRVLVVTDSELAREGPGEVCRQVAALLKSDIHPTS